MNEICFKILLWNSCKNDKNSKILFYFKVIRKEFKCFIIVKNILWVVKDIYFVIVFFFNFISVCIKFCEFVNKDIV